MVNFLLWDFSLSDLNIAIRIGKRGRAWHDVRSVCFEINNREPACQSRGKADDENESE